MPLYREYFSKVIGEDFGGGGLFNIYYILLNFLTKLVIIYIRVAQLYSELAASTFKYAYSLCIVILDVSFMARIKGYRLEEPQPEHGLFRYSCNFKQFSLY